METLNYKTKDTQVKNMLEEFNQLETGTWKFYSLYTSPGNKFGSTQDNDCKFNLDYCYYVSESFYKNIPTFMREKIIYDIRLDPFDIISQNRSIPQNRSIHPILLNSNKILNKNNPIISNLKRLQNIYMDHDIRFIGDPLINGEEVSYSLKII
jgi:hypothetical protein